MQAVQKEYPTARFEVKEHSKIAKEKKIDLEFHKGKVCNHLIKNLAINSGILKPQGKMGSRNKSSSLSKDLPMDNDASRMNRFIT